MYPFSHYEPFFKILVSCTFPIQNSIPPSDAKISRILDALLTNPWLEADVLF
jgi:hypothetical protein